jgi:hypothetical protein
MVVVYFIYYRAGVLWREVYSISCFDDSWQELRVISCLDGASGKEGLL